MLLNVRPSNEALLRAGVPGAQDQLGCPSNPCYRGGSANKGIVLTLAHLCFHHVYHESGQRLWEEVRRLVGHAFTRCCDGLHFADFGRVEQ